MQGTTAQRRCEVFARHGDVQIHSRLLATARRQRRRSPLRQPGRERDVGVPKWLSRLQSLLEVRELSAYLGLRLAVDGRTPQSAGGVPIAELRRPRAVR